MTLCVSVCSISWDSCNELGLQCQCQQKLRALPPNGAVQMQSKPSRVLLTHPHYPNQHPIHRSVRYHDFWTWMIKMFWRNIVVSCYSAFYQLKSQHTVRRGTHSHHVNPEVGLHSHDTAVIHNREFIICMRFKALQVMHLIRTLFWNALFWARTQINSAW